MRLIKFRAWDLIDEKFIYFSLFVIYFSLFVIYFSLFDLILGDAEKDLHEEIEIQQYTGLKDKNGKDIYEGDIIRFYGNYTTKDKCGWHIGVIKWNESKAKFEIFCNGVVWDIAEETDEFEDKSEVLGTIYGNPELLRGDC